MTFLDRIRDKFTLKPSYENLVDAAKRGDRMQHLVDSGHFDALLEEVMEPMYQEAFNTFTKVNPENFSEVCQAQKVGQVIEEIKKRVERKIVAGKAARLQLINLAQEEVQ